jgi:autotransporter-associated beta strand protein
LGNNDAYDQFPSGSWIMNGSMVLDSADNVSLGNVIGGGSTGNLILNNTNTVILTGANTFTGNISVNSGCLSNNVQASTGITGGFGASTVPGRTITVNAGATASTGINNWFGSGLVPDADFPAFVVNGGTLFSSRYTSIGSVALTNGATLMVNHNGNGKDGGAYMDFQFRGPITVGGSSPSTIINGDNWGDHLDTNTIFDVAVTSGSGPDLTVACPLLNQSGDYSSAAGGFTKTGPGTMLLFNSTTNGYTYTGNTTISQGTLALAGSTTISDSPAFIIAGGATFDVSGLASSFTLGSNQTLSNSTSRAVINCGSIGASTASGAVSLTYASGVPSLLVTNGTLTLASTTVFSVNNTGAALTPGTYEIIAGAATGNVGSVAGTAPSVTVGGNGLAAGAMASLQISGGVLNLVVASAASPATITGISINGSTLTITATNGAAGGQYVLLESTNLLLPLSQWTPVLTNSFNGSGDINLSTNIINANNSQEFYLLQMP